MLMPSVFGKDLFDDFFGFPFHSDQNLKRMENKLYGRRGKELMRTDVREGKDEYELEMDLPGFRKEEIQVSLENGNLTVRADKSQEEHDVKNGTYIRRERYAGSCQRSFYIGEDVCEEEIKAEFRNGILKLAIPKKEEKPAVEEKKYIAIEG